MNNVFSGWYSDFYPIQEGMDSVAMSHLTHPPMVPISPLPNPRDTNTRLCSQNLTMYAESARINKELSDLQRRITNLNVNEAQAMKRDRLAFELRYTADSCDNDIQLDKVQAV